MLKGGEPVRVIEVALVAVVVALTGAAQAAQKAHPKAPPAPSARCQTLASTIDDAVKEISYLKAEDLFDDSAPRATMRASQVGGLQGEIQSNIALMSATRCAHYSGSLSPSIYELPANQCAKEEGVNRVAAQRNQAAIEDMAATEDRTEMIKLQTALIGHNAREQAEQLAELAAKQSLGRADKIAALAKAYPPHTITSIADCDRSMWKQNPIK